MAESDFLHTAELLKAALPYVDTRTQSTMDLLLKLYEFMACYRNIRTGKMAACGFDNHKVDMEAMITNIQPLCSEKERSFIDKILNIFNAKRMFEMYNTYMSAMKAMQEFGGFGSEASEGETADNVTNNFSGFDFSSIFGNNTESKSDTSEAEPGVDNNMFNMLKSMIPPEQMSNFENLRMLFQTMSYDGSSKPDQN